MSHAPTNYKRYSHDYMHHFICTTKLPNTETVFGVTVCCLIVTSFQYSFFWGCVQFWVTHASGHSWGVWVPWGEVKNQKYNSNHMTYWEYECTSVHFVHCDRRFTQSTQNCSMKYHILHSTCIKLLFKTGAYLNMSLLCVAYKRAPGILLMLDRQYSQRDQHPYSSVD